MLRPFNSPEPHLVPHGVKCRYRDQERYRHETMLRTGANLPIHRYKGIT
jgi:hypothetical protein